MKEKYGVLIWNLEMDYEGRLDPKINTLRIKWFDTLEEAITNANGEPIIKSVAYEVKEVGDEL